MKRELSQKLLFAAGSLPAELAFRWVRVKQQSVAAEQRNEWSLRRNMLVSTPRPNESAVVTGLKRHGAVVTDLAALSLDAAAGEGIEQSGRALAVEMASRMAAMGSGSPPMLHSGPKDLLRHPTIYRWGLNAVILRIVEAYLRRPVAYDGPILFHTSVDERETGTRRWHLDREDCRMVKVALYLDDVGADGGPFQLLKQEVIHPDGRIIYRKLDTAALEKEQGRPIKAEDVVTCTGKAGTLVFADTSRFYHRAKPVLRGTRSAIFFGYFGRPPRHPFYCGRSRLSRGKIAMLTEGLHPAQQVCALWRDELPWYARLVPPSLL